MRLIFSLILCLLHSYAFAQNNLQVGYQEFPTTVFGHASDPEGNLYYTGHFKGQLTVNGNVLTQGEGLEDLFWIKLSPAGKVIRYKTFFSTRSDYTVADGLSMGSNNQMYFVSGSYDDVQFDQQLVAAYSSPFGKFMNMLTRIDTAGNVKWIRKTNVNLLKVFSSGSLVHVVGIGSGPIKSEDSIINVSSSIPSLIYMAYDTTGQLLNHKIISGNDVNTIITLQNFAVYSDGTMLFSFQMQGRDHFKVNDIPVSLPPTPAQYQILLKTDTSFTGFRSKLINPGGYQLREFPADLVTNDSLYTIISYYDGTPDAIDGYDIPIKQNMLVVFDSTLTVRRTASLGSSVVASAGYKRFNRRIFLRGIKAINDGLYFTGFYAGMNEAPMDELVAKDTTVFIIGTAMATVDLNGPSKSFVAKTSLGLSGNKVAWIGSHTPYEYHDISPLFVHSSNADRFVFLLNRDNTWNPWVVDTSLTIVSGAMKKNADRPELPQMVNFFPDGSKLMLSYASGRTALDSNKDITSNFIRQDIFFSCFNPDGSVRWYQRIGTSLIQPTVRKMVMHNGKIWFLGLFVGTQNDNNFMKVGNEVYSVGVNVTLLCSLDPSGEVKAINLPHSVYKTGIIQGFSFFKNGDLAVLINSNIPMSLPGFPGNGGFYILRVNAENGSLIEARQITSNVFPNVSHIEVDANDDLYISAILNPSAQPSTDLYLNHEGSIVDIATFPVNNSGISQAGILKMNWNKFHWLKRTYGNAGATLLSRNNLLLVNDQPVLSFRSTNSSQSLSWESQSVHNGLPANYTMIATLDQEGKLVHSRYLPLQITNVLRKGNGGNIYVSGAANVPVQLDTIQIGNAGSMDGIAIVLDSLLVARRSFRITTAYSEVNYDMDIYKDSVVALAYSAQTAPSIVISRAMVQTSDYDPNAYLTTLKLDPSVVLPVRWIDFEAKKQDQSSVRLTWEAEGQQNTDTFYIEHKKRDGHFRVIAAVKAQLLQKRYSYLHSTPDLENFYRIRHMEENGRYLYSPIRFVQFEEPSVFAVTPNPAESRIMVQTNKERLVVSVYEPGGKKVYHTLVKVGSETIDVSSLPKGLYLVVAESNGRVVGSAKFLKQ